jgi:hypothetical protein
MSRNSIVMGTALFAVIGVWIEHRNSTAAAPAASEALRRGDKESETVVNPGPDVRIELKVKRAVVKSGEKDKGPIITAELVNREKFPVVVVKPGDGSDCGRRTPLITWFVNDTKSAGGGFCGNINALKAKEVVELKAGERLELDEWIGAPDLSSAKAGVYRLYVEYDHRPDLKWGGIPLGTHDPKTMERIRASKPIKAKSNVVEIRVEE